MSLANAYIGHRSPELAWAVRLAYASACLALTSLSGCGDTSFRPLYASSGFGAGVNEKLALVDVAPIPGRVGQRIRNELIFQSTGGAAALAEHGYRLEIATRESIASTLVAIDGNARGEVYNLDASFQLIRLSDKTVVLKGISYGRASYQRVTSIFANVRARNDAENRAATSVGEEIKGRLSAFLSSAA